LFENHLVSFHLFYFCIGTSILNWKMDLLSIKFSQYTTNTNRILSIFSTDYIHPTQRRDCLSWNHLLSSLQTVENTINSFSHLCAYYFAHIHMHIHIHTYAKYTPLTKRCARSHIHRNSSPLYCVVVSNCCFGFFHLVNLLGGSFSKKYVLLQARVIFLYQ
jgi:hypothetical protein